MELELGDACCHMFMLPEAADNGKGKAKPSHPALLLYGIYIFQPAERNGNMEAPVIVLNKPPCPVLVRRTCAALLDARRLTGMGGTFEKRAMTALIGFGFAHRPVKDMSISW